MQTDRKQTHVTILVQPNSLLVVSVAAGGLSLVGTEVAATPEDVVDCGGGWVAVAVGADANDIVVEVVVDSVVFVVVAVAVDGIVLSVVTVVSGVVVVVVSVVVVVAAVVVVADAVVVDCVGVSVTNKMCANCNSS